MAQSSSNAAGLSRGFRTWSFYRRRPRSAARATPRAGWDEATNGFVGSGNHTLSWIANILVTLVALLHVYFRVPEMFLWTKPLGLRTFWLSLEKATDSAVLAANQGLYKGFLAAGLFWGPVHPTPSFTFQIKAFFLVCVIVAGVYGAATVSRRILYLQAAPAALALIVLWLA